MKTNKILKQWIVTALCLCLLIQYIPMGANAVSWENLCEHHPEHTEDCGYVQTREDARCDYFCEICNVASAEGITEPDAETQPLEVDALSPAAAEGTVVASGTCGDNLTWTLDDVGTLTISGTGAMDDWTSDDHAPWYENREIVKTVVVEEGVTSIGNRAFFECRNLATADLPDSATVLGEYAFYNCNMLTAVDLPAGLTAIGNGTFRNCYILTDITLPAGITAIGDYAFCACTCLPDITFPAGLASIGMSAFEGCNSMTAVTFTGDAQVQISVCGQQNPVDTAVTVILRGNFIRP